MPNLQVQSGSFKVEEDSTGKFVTCVTAGGFSFPQNAAYGTWEWEMYKDLGASALGISFISEEPIFDPNVNSYHCRITNTEKVVLYEFSVGWNSIIESAASYVNIKQWYKFKITRTLNGEFKFYTDNILIGTAINTNHTTSQFVITDMDAGDRIRNFKHSLGVIQ